MLNKANVLIFGLLVVVFSLAQTGCAGLESKRTSTKLGDIYSFQDDLKVGDRGPEMVVIPKGSFVMGDLQGSGRPNEQAHEVHVNQAYAIGKYEVTVSEFRTFVEATGYVSSAEKGQGCYTYNKNKSWGWVGKTDWQQPNFSQGDDHPVVCISWNDAVAYTKWLSEQTGQQYQLPTEAQWEYVARAGTDTNFWWGNDETEGVKCVKANCCLGSDWLEKQTVPVGGFAPNKFGVHDTVGNVWEWTASNYVEQYNGEELRMSEAEQLDTMRVMRGGSWYNFPSDTRAAKRAKNWQQSRSSTTGFRVARIVTPELVKVALGNQ